MKHHLKDDNHNNTIMNMLNHMNRLTPDSKVKTKIRLAKQETRFKMMDEIRPGWDKSWNKNAG